MNKLPLTTEFKYLQTSNKVNRKNGYEILFCYETMRTYLHLDDITKEISTKGSLVLTYSYLHLGQPTFCNTSYNKLGRTESE